MVAPDIAFIKGNVPFDDSRGELHGEKADFPMIVMARIADVALPDFAHATNIAQPRILNRRRIIGNAVERGPVRTIQTAEGIFDLPFRMATRRDEDMPPCREHGIEQL